MTVLYARLSIIDPPPPHVIRTAFADRCGRICHAPVTVGGGGYVPILDCGAGRVHYLPPFGTRSSARAIARDYAASVLGRGVIE